MEKVTKKRKVLAINPLIHIIYGGIKTGKTSIVSKLEDHYIVELEPTGAHFIEGFIHDIGNPNEFNQLLDMIETSKTKFCTYLVIDTISKLDEWSEIVGTYEYMNKVQGKSFNISKNPAHKGRRLNALDPEFETVHEIPQGYGYIHSRNVMMKWFNRFSKLIQLKKVDYVILLAHTKDKYKEKDNVIVSEREIDLTGKVAAIYLKYSSSVAHFYRKGTEGHLYYDPEQQLSGSRPKHLSGDFIISKQLENKDIETYWDKIYK